MWKIKKKLETTVVLRWETVVLRKVRWETVALRKASQNLHQALQQRRETMLCRGRPAAAVVWSRGGPGDIAHLRVILASITDATARYRVCVCRVCACCGSRGYRRRLEHRGDWRLRAHLLVLASITDATA